MVWAPDFTDYFLNKLKEITIPDQYGNPTPITVDYMMPGKELDLDSDIKRPAITVYNYDFVPDLDRAQSIVRLKVAEDENGVSISGLPDPWKIYYQFTLLADYLEHIDLMEIQFKRMFPFRGVIVMTDSDGSKVSYDMFFHQYIALDTNMSVPQGGSATKRVFRRVYRYYIPAELDSNQVTTYKRVLERNIVLKQKHGGGYVVSFQEQD